MMREPRTTRSNDLSISPFLNDEITSGLPDDPSGMVSREAHVPAGEKPVSVSEITGKIKRLLETQVADVFVTGEVSGFKQAASGHLYFDLKDDRSVICCVMYAREAAGIKGPVRDGMQVEVRGRISVYEKRGNYQLSVQQLRPAGQGRLFQAFMEMKDRLAAEGLFEPSRKRQLPPHPRCVGLVTSPQGAALRDMVNVLGRRAPHIAILVWPARVQGEGAAEQVAQGIERFNEMGNIDVMIVGRGGGSLEDLWAFNEEIVARAIYASKIPIISAVGHEIDFTIADYVADLRAPTPSAAAELVALNNADLMRHIVGIENQMLRFLREQYRYLETARQYRARLESLVPSRVHLMQAKLKEFDRSGAFHLATRRINENRQLLDDYVERMNTGFSNQVKGARQLEERLNFQLRALNPKAILKRGYSITFDSASGSVISSSDETQAGQSLRIVLGKGQIEANVTAPGQAVAPVKQRNKRATKGTQLPLEWFGGNANLTGEEQ